ncbi:MAG: hypothetical protein ACKV22_38385 [Bryobacteraceae bacterium]
MSKHPSKSQPTWTEVKAKLAGFDRTDLLALIRDLYATHKDNQRFLHARFGLGEDVLNPYKQTIDRWLWPDVFLKQNTSVAKARQAISDYRKAVGEPDGLAELMVFYCERAAGFIDDLGNDDEGYCASFLRMFEQALKTYTDAARQQPRWSRRPPGSSARHQSKVWLWHGRGNGFRLCEVHEGRGLIARAWCTPRRRLPMKRSLAEAHGTPAQSLLGCSRCFTRSPSEATRSSGRACHE